MTKLKYFLWLKEKWQVFIVLSILNISICSAQKQTSDSVMIRRIYNMALTNGKCYHHLERLCKEAPARLSGSANADKAVELTFDMLRNIEPDTVWLQPVMVPHWVRGTKATCNTINTATPHQFNILALGGSVPTPSGGIKSEVIEINSIKELDALGESRIKGKIVFFNRALDKRIIDTFESYGGCADQRLYGADEASKYGAVGVLVRSLTLHEDEHPHTGMLIYKTEQRIPSAAISARDANTLSALLKKNKVMLDMEMDCRSLPDKQSYNVIAEIKGSEYPDEIILVGGHLDSWDNSEGAHDDGAGCVHSIEVLSLFKKLDYKPRRTIRCVLFMNEENGSKGARLYADEAKRKGEKHLVGIESDRGGFSPHGFTVDGDDEERKACLKTLQKWRHLFKPYLVHLFEYGGSGVDVSKLKGQGVALLGFIPDSQRYFDYHHASTDNFVNVNRRELEMGSATITALVYLFDQYGLNP
ncbi:MAG: M20/M25/M40 family metallo-hydrolase [Candidatus Competibacteraceae bacterium]|nr:M20/M25/M40 family metallo-hydrolase [Candidatus Competibacteraceae bacterium]